jgi:hypothetical protein
MKLEMKVDVRFATSIFLMAMMCVQPALAATGGNGVAPTFGAKAQTDQDSAQAPAQPDEIHRLWATEVTPKLSRLPKSDNDAYYYGELLMVPLHAAFYLKDAGWQREFSEHFAKLVADPSVLPSVMLDRTQYLYLATEFVRLARESDQLDLIPQGLPELLYNETDAAWRTKPAWMWARPAFHGARERVLWKLNTHNVPYGYYRLMFDDDMFLFAMAADLKDYTRGVALPDWAPTLNDILAVSYRVFKQEVAWHSDGGWIFQPGVFADHAEYKYAGNAEVRPDLKPKPVPGISLDTSHTLRYPLWMESQIQAYPEGSEQRAYYERMKDGLNFQFFNKALVPPDSHSPCYRVNNFFDGSNGVYRYNYANVGQGKGYGPYQLSVALLVGWWPLLKTSQSRELYQNLAKSFPWPHECIDLYLGPTNQHKEDRFHPDGPGMRQWHLLVELGARF